MITLLQPLQGLCRRARRFLDLHRGATRREPVPFARKALFEALEQRMLLSATLPGVAEATDAVDADAVTAAAHDLLAFEAPAAPAVSFTLAAEPNTPPTIAFIPDMAAFEHQVLVVAVTANDVDQDPLTYSLETRTKATIDSHGVIEWKVLETDGPTEHFTVFVSDGEFSASRSFAVGVIETNSAPVLTPLDRLVATEDEPFSFRVSATDPDIPRNTLTFSLDQGPTGAAIDPVTGEVSWQPGEAEAGGTFEFLVGVIDNGSPRFPDTETYTVFVTPVNDAPVAVDDAFTTDEDVAVSGNVLMNDTDVDTTKLSALLESGPAHGVVELDPKGSFTYTPNKEFSGTDSFSYVASDGEAKSLVAFVTITVEAASDAPVAVDDVFATDEDNSITVAAPGVLGNDTDADSAAVTAVLVSGPAHGTVVLNSDGSFTYTPAENFNGSDAFTYRANDGQLDSDEATVTIQVAAVNDAPVAVDDAFTTDEDKAVKGKVLANDIDVDSAKLSALLESGPAHGVVELDPEGAFTYTPNREFSGTDSFSYVASDGEAKSLVAFVTITVEAASDAPVAVDDVFATDEDNSITVAAPGVLGNDTDADSAAVTAVLVSGPAHGTVVLNSDGSFTYTPAENFNGSDAFTYRANDGELDSGEATVTIRVAPVNDAPTLAVIPDMAVSEHQELVVPVVANDADLDTLVFSLGGDTPEGATIDSATGEIRWRAGEADGPRAHFTVFVSDGEFSASRSFAVGVIETNSAPVLTPLDRLVATEDEPFSFRVSATDPDIPRNTLTFSLDQGPTGAAIDPVTGEVSWQPGEAEAGGTFEFLVGVIDNGSPRFPDTETYTVFVTPVNDAPVAVDDAFTTDEDKAVSGNVLTNDTDVDSKELTALLESAPAHGTVELSPDGSFTYTPALNFSGTDSFTYRANDGQADSAAATISLTVNPLNNSAPIFTTVPVTEFILKSPGVSGDSVFRVAGTPGQSVSMQLDWLEREAAYDNEVGIYRVADLDGRVNGIAPGDAGYAEAALGNGNSTVIFASGKGAGAATTLTLRAGDLYGFYLIQNDTTSHFLSANPENRTGCGPLAFFSVAGANPDRFDHLHGAFQADGSVKLAWEDLTSGGDKDFNDVVVRATALALPEGAGYVYRSHADDVDGDTLTYSLVEGPQGAKVDPLTGKVTWQPIAPGTYRFVLRAEDGHAGAAEQAFDLVVRRAERALYVRGTEQGDHIEVFEHDGAVQVRVNGDTRTYFGVSVIHVESFGGSDRIELAGVTVRTFVDAGAGNDEIDAGDVIVVGVDLRGGLGNDEIEGGHGADRIDGGGGNDEIEGGDGADWIDGGDGRDELEGGRGDDVLLGGTGDDRLIGGRGDDLLVGGPGRDRLDGRPGNDRTIDAGLLAGPTPPAGIAPVIDWGGVAELGRLSDPSDAGEPRQSSWVADFVTTLGQTATELNPNAGIMIVVNPAPR